jgi:hypothetical protein
MKGEAKCSEQNGRLHYGDERTDDSIAEQ